MRLALLEALDNSACAASDFTGKLLKVFKIKQTQKIIAESIGRRSRWLHHVLIYLVGKVLTVKTNFHLLAKTH